MRFGVEVVLRQGGGWAGGGGVGEGPRVVAKRRRQGNGRPTYFSFSLADLLGTQLLVVLHFLRRLTLRLVRLPPILRAGLGTVRGGQWVLAVQDGSEGGEEGRRRGSTRRLRLPPPTTTTTTRAQLLLVPRPVRSPGRKRRPAYSRCIVKAVSRRRRSRGPSCCSARTSAPPRRACSPTSLTARHNDKPNDTWALHTIHNSTNAHHRIPAGSLAVSGVLVQRSRLSLSWS